MRSGRLARRRPLPSRVGRRPRRAGRRRARAGPRSRFRAVSRPPDVSRHHARIRIAGDQATIEDLDSKNGTFVTDRRLDAAARLADGDSIRIGSSPADVQRRAKPGSTETQSPAGAVSSDMAGAMLPCARAGARRRVPGQDPLQSFELFRNQSPALPATIRRATPPNRPSNRSIRDRSGRRRTWPAMPPCDPAPGA